MSCRSRPSQARISCRTSSTTGNFTQIVSLSIVLILDLGLGQRRALDHRPHDRLGAAIELAATWRTSAVRRRCAPRRGSSSSCRDCRNRRSMPRRLNSSPWTLIQCAAKSRHSWRNSLTGTSSLFLPLARYCFLDLPFDRQAVAVPARHVVRIVAAHLERAGDDVLQDLVQRVADMDVAVGIGRAVMQHEFFAAGGGGAQLACRGPSPASA